MATTTYKSYVPTPSPIAPTGNQVPFNNENLNPIGSHYGTLTSNEETMLIQRAIVREIFDATPQKYKLLRLFFDKPISYQPLDEFSYLEKTFGRTALKAASGVGAPGTNTQQSVVLTTTENINVNKIIVYPDGTHGIVTSVTPGTDTITVKPLLGGALPAVSTNDYFSIQGGIIADGMNFFTHYDRMTTVERYNYIMLMQRDKRWTRMEMQKYQNASTTNYFDLDKKEQADFLYQDMFVSILNGALGKFELTGGYEAKSMAGIFPSMVAAGCSHADSTPATAVSDFETLAFSTDYKTEGATRFILGTPQTIYNLGKLWKEPGIYYSPNDRIADLNLTQYKLGTMNFVPIEMQVFQEKSMFPESWANRLICLDMDTIQPVCMTGYLPVEMGETMNKQQGTREDYKEWWMQACLSLKFNNPLSSFYMDLSGM